LGFFSANALFWRKVGDASAENIGKYRHFGANSA
jgi:hypothetical protein